VARHSHGFVYYVSLTGITGAALGRVSEIGRNVEQIRKLSKTPIAVGFGITTPQDAADVAAVADGVIVGSAIVKQIAACQQQQGMIARVSGFVQSLKSAMAPQA
jgi:tryptophan synthase alpha chain